MTTVVGSPTAQRMNPASRCTSVRAQTPSGHSCISSTTIRLGQLGMHDKTCDHGKFIGKFVVTMTCQSFQELIVMIFTLIMENMEG